MRTSTYQKSKGSLFDRDTITHLRIPFSFFLLPVFCFALSQVNAINTFNAVIVFVALHFFIYPGSNIYNSYMDKDTGSIGGLKNPPPVTKKLFWVSIIFDSIGLLLCIFISWKLLLLMLVYVGVSKAYSWDKIRLKKYGILSWLIVMLFQGGYTFLLVHAAASNELYFNWLNEKNMEAMLLASLLIGGFYPLTQVYQHKEDNERGDKTISYLLSINGTFIFTALVFLFACITSYHYFFFFYTLKYFYIFMTCLFPVIIYFIYWFISTLKNQSKADYEHTMRMTFISSICMIICFTVLFIINH